MQAKALFELGRAAEAKASFDRLLQIPQVAANGEIHWLILHDRGRIAEEEKNFQEAERFYLRAAEVVERQRASINTEANKIGFVGDKQSIYTKLVGVQFQLGKNAQAFESMERAKSRALVDMLASRQSFASSRSAAGSKEQVQAALNKLNEEDIESRGQRESTIANTVAQSRGVGNADTVKTLAKELPAAMASLVSVSSLDIKEVQALLGSDESLLIYFGDLAHMYASVVTIAGVSGVRIESTNLERDLRKLRKDLQEDGVPVDDLLRSLYRTLIAPVEPLLKGSRLSIVPHALLHYLPFSALNDGGQALVDKFSLRQLPSASVMKYMRQSNLGAPGVSLDRMLILGNPDLRNPELDLPGSQIESEKLASRFSVKNLLLREKASRVAFSALAPNAPYIHVASHGKFNAARPLQSGLLLAAEQGVSGQLTVSDLYAMELNAEMVTLSACETGLGAVANGDDVVGLTRGFLYAGVSTVIASLWQVDDEATAFLMLSMYEHLRQGDRRNALRRAQIETRAKYPHPYYWASFYLTGVN
jgi:CHAT domain-containing protein